MPHPLRDEIQRNYLLFDLAAFVIVVAGMKAAEAVIVPFLLAAFIAIIAGTPVFWLTRLRVPTMAAIVLVLGGLVGLFVGVGAVVGQSIEQFLAQLPVYSERATALTAQVAEFAGRFGVPVDVERISNFIDPGQVMNLVGSVLRGFGGVLSNGFLILFTVIFILLEASSFPKKLQVTLADPASSIPHFQRFTSNVNRYMGIKTTISLATGTIISIWLTILDVDFPLLWGMLAFLLNYVPNIGSIIAAVPAVLLAIVQLGPTHALLVLAGFVSVNVFMGNVIEPRFMGRGLGLSTLVVWLSLVFWGWALGPVGMLLSVPLTMTVKIALEASPRTHWMAVLLGPEMNQPDTATASVAPETDAEPTNTDAASTAVASADGDPGSDDRTV